jgi:hypothetical protein
MTCDLFQLLSPAGQLRYVLLRGTYLAQRWEPAGGVNLYHVPNEARGFFVEVGYDEATLAAVVLRSFQHAEPLEDYTHPIRLPGTR